MTRVRLRVIFSGAYLAVYVLMAALAIYVLVTDTANSEFSGLGMILVTYPWSLLWGPVIDKLGVTAWYGHFAGNPALYGILASIALLSAAIPYAVLLYRIGKSIDNTRCRSQGTMA